MHPGAGSGGASAAWPRSTVFILMVYGKLGIPLFHYYPLSICLSHREQVESHWRGSGKRRTKDCS
jgi:hypothetical protein